MTAGSERLEPGSSVGPSESPSAVPAHGRGVVPSEDPSHPDGAMPPTGTLERGLGGHWGENIERPDDGPEPGADSGSPTRAKRGLGGLAALGALLLKFGAKLKFLIFLLPKVKFLAASATMLLSIGAYSLLWGLPFAVGFVALLLVHELGHVIQLRREGIRATAPMFIPFLGAFVGMKEMPKDAAAEARVGLAGPVLGSLGCLVPLAIHLATGSEMFLALAFVGFFLNLFNLMPVLPLDGGRAMAALSPWLWIVGFGLLIAATIAFPNPIMPLILILGGFETFRRFRARRSPEYQRYIRVPPRTRAAVAAVYIGLAVALAVGMDLTFVARSAAGS